MSRLNSNMYSNQANINTTTRSEQLRLSLKRRTLPKNNDLTEINEEISKSSLKRYSKLLNAFESEALKRDSINLNTEQSDEKRHRPSQITHNEIFYKPQDGVKGNHKQELDIGNTLHDTSPGFEEIASNDLKHIFEQAKHEIFSNIEESIEPNRIGTQAKFNLNIKEADINEMAYNITQEFNKISKVFEDPNSLKPTEDPYGVKRGICENCLEGCRGYNQSTNCLDTMSSICSSCNCGASAHKQINFDDLSLNSFVTSIKKDILPHVSHINDDTIMFDSFLAVFSLSSKNENKGEKVLSSDYVIFLLNLFREAGFKVIASEIKDFSKDENKLHDNNFNYDMKDAKGEEFREYLSQFYDLNTGGNSANDNNRVSKSQFASASVLPNFNKNKTDFKNIFLKNYKDDDKKIQNSGLKETTFEKLRKWDNTNNNHKSINYNNQSNNLSSSNFFLKLRKDEATNNFNQNTNFNKNNGININLSSTAKRISYFELIKNPLLCLCLSTKSSNLSNDSNTKNSNIKSNTITNHFEKIYYVIKHNPNFQNCLGNNLQLIYYSKNKLNALWDLQTVFPDLFKINSNIVVISEKPNLFSGNMLTTTNYFNEENETREMNEANQNSEEKNVNIGNIYNKDNLFGTFTSFTQSEDKPTNSANKQKKLLETVYQENEKKILPRNNSLPSQFYQYFSQFKDFLIYNAISCTSTALFDNFESLVNFSKNNFINENECDSIYVNNFLNYISNSSFMERNSSKDRKISISLLKKINAFNNYNPLGFFNNLEMINIKEKKEQEILSNLFLKEDSTKYSRILLVFRPLAVRSGLSECILNIFKINECFVLKKKSVILNRSQIEFLYDSEFSSTTSTNKTNLLSFEDYFKIMSDFSSEIVVLSKFGILEDTKLLCGNSNEYTDNINVCMQNSLAPVLSHLGNIDVEFEVENDLIHKDDKIKSQKYHEKINFNLQNKNSNTGSNLESFFSINSLINLEGVFNSMIGTQLEKMSNNYEKLNSFQQNLIRFTNQFNLFTYNTRSLHADSSYSNSQQDINFFFPEFGSMQEVVLLIKPSENSEAINDAIKQTFLKMDFEVLDAVKYIMKDEEFGNLFDKYFTMNAINPFDYSTAKETFTSGNETEVLRMVKPGGKSELNKIIGKENLNVLLRTKSDDKAYDDFILNMSTNIEKMQIIKDYCYLLNISTDIEYFYPIVNSRVSIIEGQYLLQHAEYVEVEEKAPDLNNYYTSGDKLGNKAYMDIPSVSFLTNLSQQRNLMQTQNQSLTFNKDSMLMIHVLNSCLKCTVGDSMRYDLVNDGTKEKLIDRYLKFYYYDCENFGNEKSTEVNLNMFSKWKKGKSDFNEKYFEVLHFNDDCLSTQISFFVESNAMGFFEVRVPILENDLFTHNEIDIAINYLYCDPSFYHELEEKFKSENSNKIGCVIMDVIPFFEMNDDNELTNNLVKDSNRNTSIDIVKNKLNKKENISQQNLRKMNEEWVNNNLINLYTNVENQGEINSNRNNANDNREKKLEKNDPNKLMSNKIRENLHTIKKRIFYKTKYELCKFFYKSCSVICSYLRENSINRNHNITPNNYHFRIKPEDITSDITRIYQVEEFAGLHFIEMVAQDFSKYRVRERGNKALDNTNEYLTYSTPSIQSSLPVFLWGRKLAEICKILQTKSDMIIEDINYEDISNAGPIIYSIKEQKLKGVINNNCMVEYSQYLYINILEDLKSAQGEKGLLDYKIFSENQFKIVEDKLHKILTSRVFKESRLADNLTISPVRIGENNLRINKRIEYSSHHEDNNVEKSNQAKTDIDSELKSLQNFKQIEENSQNQNGEVTNKIINLIDVFCHKSSKYHAYAAILYLIKIIFKKLTRKSYLLQDNELEYDRMIDALLTGFDSNIDYDKPDTNDEECFNAYKSEYFLYCLSEIKFMLNEVAVYKAKLSLLQQDIRSMKSNSQSPVNKEYNIKTNTNIEPDYDTEIKILNKNISSMKNNINELSMNIEIVFSELHAYDIHHRIRHKEDTKIIYLPKERYHIPMYFPQHLEKDVENPKYQEVKKVKESYLMDLNKVNYMNRNRDQRKTNRIVDEGLENQLIVTENKLRESKIEYRKDICIEKKKDQSRRHPIKLFAELVKKKNIL